MRAVDGLPRTQARQAALRGRGLDGAVGPKLRLDAEADRVGPLDALGATGQHAGTHLAGVLEERGGEQQADLGQAQGSGKGWG